MAIGREQPRRIVGTVNTAEFLVTLGATLGFVVGLWEDIVTNLSAVVALLIGGCIAAPIAAWVISRIEPVVLGGLVGTAIVTLNIGKVLGGIETYFGLTVPGFVSTLFIVLILIVGISATIHGARATRAARARELEAENAETKAHAEFHTAACAHSAAGSSQDVNVVEESAPRADKA